MRQSPNSGIFAGAWGLAAGLVGSLCCLGPSAAVLLGLGSSSALLALALERTLALAGGVALLLAGLALALRRPGVCERRPPRWRAPALMLASFALAYALLGLLAPALAARQEDIAASAPAAAQGQIQSLPEAAVAANTTAPLRRVTLIVAKMECPPCAAHIRGLLSRKPYVRGFFAEEMIDQVTIDYDSGQIDAKQLAALFPASYGVTLIGDEPIP